jgi:hypothetical protein
MHWREQLLEQLATATPGGYFARGEAASEPTGWAGLAQSVNGNDARARIAADWLVAQQAKDGSIGVTATQSTPAWPTSLAILLWQAINDPERYGKPTAAAVAWALGDKGTAHEHRPEVGHDTLLVGWSWTANTHSWLEPTAMFVMALRAAGKDAHPRTREAVRLIVDRILSQGGCNCGNTTVLGQELLPHVEPSGLAMMALAGEQLDDPRIERTLQYLERELSVDTTTASLSYGLLGLAAHRRSPADRMVWLETAYDRSTRQPPSPYKLALLALAASDEYPFAAVTEATT